MTHPSLKAMAEDKSFDGVAKMTIFTVDPDLVEFEPGFNPRDPGPELDAHLEAMYVAMKAGASFPPIDVIVVDGRVIARRGHCRTTTARRLKAEGIPVLLQARHCRGNEVDQTFDLLGENMGKPFTPLEQGRVFLRLKKYNMTVPQIVERTGLHRTTIDNGILLAEAPVELQQMLINGDVSAQVALEALKAHGSKAVEALKGVLTKVKAQGGKKVTRKHMVTVRVPPKAAVRFYTASVEIAKHVNPDWLNGDEAELKERMIEIPAAALKELLAASNQCAAPSANQEDEL